MMNRRWHSCVRVAPVVVALGLAIIAQPGWAQPVISGQSLKFTEYYDAPHETQMKSLLEGDRAQRLPDGRIQVTGAKRRTFRENGESEFTVEAPECLYDPVQRALSSSGPLRLQTGDGKFAIEGEGFLWQQTNSTLLVSNRVHTILHPELFGPQAAPPLTNRPVTATTGIEIFSDQFEYAQMPGRGVYQGNVRVTGTNLNATAGRLTILLPLAEHRLRSLTAEEHVVVDYEQAHATGEWVFYSADTEVIQLKGQPTWRIEQREGSGDDLVFERTNRVYRANGHARLQMPASSMGAAGFLSPPASASAPVPPPTNRFVEVRCDNYVLRTNIAVFRDQVRVTDRLGDQVQGEMTCGLMTLTFAGTNELQQMVAEQEVVIAQADRRFTATRAEYTATNSLLELIGNPTWRDGLREGRGDQIRVNLAREEMSVREHAYMKLPAAELGQSALAGAGEPASGQAKAGAPAFAEIYCQDYALTADSALFQGGVRIEHPQMKWTCDRLALLSPPELGKDGHRMIAEPAVVFDLLDDRGQKYHGTGKKAVYTRRLTATLTNDLMELTGTPATLEATNVVIRNNVIVLDMSNHKLATPGKFNFQGTSPPVATNYFRPR